MTAMPPTGPTDPNGVPPRGVTEQSDAALTQDIREGAQAAADAALDELFRRHRAPVLGYARTCCRDPHTAEDLTSEAFARTLQAIRAGGGPSEAWRPYLLTTVRRTAAAWSATERRTELSPDFERWLDQAPMAESVEESMVRAEDSHLVLRAFRSLPERWQTALWHSEVENETAPRVATLLGISPSGLTSLTARAREGLREAYLTAHTARVDKGGSEECRRYTGLLAASVRRAGRRTNRDLERHLADCPTCQAARLELTELNSSLRAVLPAAILLWGGAAYVAKATAAGATAGMATAAGAGTGTGSGIATGVGTGAGTGAGMATGTKVGAAVGASVLALAVGGFALFPGDEDPEPRAAPAPSATRTPPPPRTPEPSSTPERSPTPTPTPTTTKPSPSTRPPGPPADERTRLRIASTGLCMDIAPTEGAAPRETACTGARSQQWDLLLDRPAQEARIRNRATGLCLTHTGAESDGAPVRQRACGSASATPRTARWTYFPKDGTVAFAQKGSALHFLGLDDWHEAEQGENHSATIGTTPNYYDTKSLRFRYDGATFAS